MTCTEESKEHIEYTFHAFCKVVIRNARYTALRDWSRTRNMVFRRRKSGNGTGAAAAPPATISANPYTNDKHPKQIYSCKTYNAYGNSSAAQNSGGSRSPSAGRKSGAPIFTAAPGGYSSVPAPFSFSHPSTAGSLISSTLRHSFVPSTFATALRCFRRKRLS